MLGWIYKAFDELADFITRLPLIMLVLAALMGYRYYEVQTLFLRVLPADITSRSLASGLIAAVFIFSTIIFMVHAFRIGTWVKAGLFITAWVINLYFWQVTTGDWIFKLFISTVIALFDIGFSYLFHIIRSEQAVAKKLQVLEQAYRIEMASYQSLLDKQKQLQSESASLSKLIQQHTCPHCQQLFPSPKSVNAHKAYCRNQSISTRQQPKANG